MKMQDVTLKHVQFSYELVFDDFAERLNLVRCQPPEQRELDLILEPPSLSG